MGLSKDGKIQIGKIKKGNKNLITDVKGVKVGHVTLNDGKIKTGVTAILPHEGNIFKEKVMGAASVINGFGKSMGLLQIEELGSIETPIMMTNTLSVGTVAEGLIKYMLSENDDIGTTTGTVNCVVTECNDGTLNDIRGLHVKEEHVLQAINNAAAGFEEGAVGAGTGMVCFDLKGGIGSSSRIVKLDNKEYTIGTLVLANFGSKKYLTINGDKIGERIHNSDNESADQGSIIIIIATDMPLSERQLKRIANRSVVGLVRTGSYLGNGSGDICISFTTANTLKHYSDTKIIDLKMIEENSMDYIFKVVAESVEESIISALYHAETTTGINGKTVKSLKEYL
ncbi:P1 family peptidase [Sedimentibacter sp.]|uniref:DmpA family aminopeptidase n=1 Tax=Sedimentibacter sp. TaxID=1960295 RepID=UPI0028A73FAB|nr:P1 family peptidase [Sedimentibacter sp.]